MKSLLKEFIEEEGYIVDLADDDLEALKKIAKQPFNLIIMDLQIPGLIGIDILPQFKKFQPDISIIVISAFGSERARRKAFERGATVCIKKPIDFQKLKTLVHDLVSSGEICLD